MATSRDAVSLGHDGDSGKSLSIRASDDKSSVRRSMTQFCLVGDLGGGTVLSKKGGGVDSSASRQHNIIVK